MHPSFAKQQLVFAFMLCFHLLGRESIRMHRIAKDTHPCDLAGGMGGKRHVHGTGATRFAVSGFGVHVPGLRVLWPRRKLQC